MSNLSLLIVFVSVILRSSHGYTNRSETESLYTVLLSNGSSYYKNIRPGVDQRNATTVTVNMHVTSIHELEEMTGRFTVVAFLDINWVDERLSWTSTSYRGNIEEMELPQSDVWKPSLTLSNPFLRLKALGSDDNLVRYKHSGDATWSVGDVMQAICDVDVTYYPFDKQVCPLYFRIWGYEGSDIILTPSANGVGFSYYVENSEWDVMKTENEVVVSETPYIVYKFHLERKSTFFIISIYIPVVLLTGLCPLVFLLPAESGERVSFSITCLLAIAVFLTIVSESLPRSSSPISVLSFFLMCDFVLATCLCVLTILGLQLYHKDGKDHDIPVLLKKIAAIRCSGRNRRTQRKAASNKTLTTEEQTGEGEEVTWRTIARMFDILCFVLSIGACVALLVIYLMYTNIV